MQILDTELKDVKIMIFDKREDIRGCVKVTINNAEMARQGLHFVCKEQRIYHIPKKGTFYGIHFQTKSHPQDKIIHLLAGRGIDYIIDCKRILQHTKNGLLSNCRVMMISISIFPKDMGMLSYH